MNHSCEYLTVGCDQSTSPITYIFISDEINLKAALAIAQAISVVLDSACRYGVTSLRKFLVHDYSLLFTINVPVPEAEAQALPARATRKLQRGIQPCPNM